MDDVYPLIFINGSNYMVTGFTGDCAPPVVGTTPSRLSSFYSTSTFYIGDQAMSLKSLLEFCYPIHKGVINDFSSMSKIWRHTFYNELRVAPEEHPVIMGENIGNTKKKQEKTAEIFFEEFDVPAFHLSQNSTLALYCSGRTTGTVVQLGDELNAVVCISEGYCLSDSFISDFSGKQISEYLAKLLKPNLNFNTSKIVDLEVIRQMKECRCFITLDETKETSSKHYELPDGKGIEIGEPLYQAPEILFKPKLIESKSTPLHQMISDCIYGKNSDLRKELFSNIVLEGGSSMFQGLPERLTIELENWNPGMKLRVIHPPERKYSQWIGASILSSLSSFEKEWISHSQYEEIGPSVIQKSCISNPQYIVTERKYLDLDQEIVKVLGRYQLQDIKFNFN